MEVRPGVSETTVLTVEQELKLANEKLIKMHEDKLAEANAKLEEYKAKVEAESKKEAKPNLMEAIAPNMLESAKKKVAKMDGVEVPESIISRESGHYHLLLISTEADFKSKKFSFVVRTVKLTVQGYTKHKKSYIGAEDVVMFHNPTKKG